ncbi:RNA 2',3'-cyclic phosphodiesterase [Candidatus Woesebacteria bacterium]|nr:RNA 2',3'-cyclic phosphodiesterase [Candidatus Woesebacteria bacterium]
MKLFFAYRIPEEVVGSLNDQLEECKKSYQYFQWVPQKNYHITVFYVGEVTKHKVSSIVNRAEKALFESEHTHIFSYGLDLFVSHKITLYLALQRNKMLESIHAQLMRAFVHGSSKSKQLDYIPHISVARYKIPSKQQYLHLKKYMERYEIDIDFPIDSLDLLESVPNGKHPIYNHVASFKLL